MDDLNAVLKLDPNNAYALAVRGCLHELEQDYPKALADFDRALKLNPRDAHTLVNRAQVHEYQDHHDKAKADFEAAARLGFKDYRLSLAKARIALEQGDTDKALSEVAEALRQNPDEPQCHVFRGFIRLEAKDYDEALKDFDAAVARDPHCLDAYTYRAWLHETKKDYRRALADYDEIVRLKPPDPTYAAACDRRAWIRATCPEADLRDGKVAVEAATEACQRTKSSNPGYLLTLAAAQAESGDFAAAVKTAEKAKALFKPDDQHLEWCVYLLNLFRQEEPYRLPEEVVEFYRRSAGLPRRRTRPRSARRPGREGRR